MSLSTGFLCAGCGFTLRNYLSPHLREKSIFKQDGQQNQTAYSHLPCNLVTVWLVLHMLGVYVFLKGCEVELMRVVGVEKDLFCFNREDGWEVLSILCK